MKEQIQDAIADGRRPVGMMHHGLVPHTSIQPTISSPNTGGELHPRVAQELADAG